MSTAAARAKYLYNKKYQDAYWERRAQREGVTSSNNETKTTKKHKVVCYNNEETTPVDEIKRLKEIKGILTDDLGEPISCCINRKDYVGKDEEYINALEDSNKVMSSENRRLIKLLRQYQDIIKIGIYSVCVEQKIKACAV